jgi:hypothetical protein
MAPAAYSGTMRLLGVVPTSVPFFDGTYVLGAAECARRGIDVNLTNPCDPEGRVYDYSPLLLDIMPPGVAVSWTIPAGMLLIAVFCAVLTLLPAPRRWPDLAVMVLAVLSPMTVYALERANIDAFILPVMVLAGLALHGPMGRRLLGYALALFAGLLKFYPLAALVIVARERLRVALLLGGVTVIALAGFIWIYAGTLFHSIANRPVGFTFTDGFAAANLPDGMAEILAPVAAGHEWAEHAVAWIPLVLGTLLTLRLLLQAFRYAGRIPITVLHETETVFLVIGAALVAGCFLTGLSFYYRGVDLLLVLPGLLLLRPIDKTAADMVKAILFLMWSEAIRQGMIRLFPAIGLSPDLDNKIRAVFWLIRELVWWRVAGALLGIVLWFVLASECGLWLRGHIRRLGLPDPLPITEAS